VGEPAAECADILKGFASAVGDRKSAGAVPSGSCASRPRPLLKLFWDRGYEQAISHLGPVAGPSSVLLDLGCGYGLAMDFLGVLEGRWIGVDISEPWLRRARADRPGDSHVLGDAERIPLADGSVDGLFCMSVLQYVDWRRAVRECVRVLRPGGRAVFVENLAGNPIIVGYRWLARLLGWRFPRHLTPRAHVRWDERHCFTELFGEARFETLHLTTPFALIGPVLGLRLLGRPMPVRAASRRYRLLGRLDRWPLSRFPRLAGRAWLMIVLATKVPGAAGGGDHA